MVTILDNADIEHSHLPKVLGQRWFRMTRSPRHKLSPWSLSSSSLMGLYQVLMRNTEGKRTTPWGTGMQMMIGLLKDMGETLSSSPGPFLNTKQKPYGIRERQRDLSLPVFRQWYPNLKDTILREGQKLSWTLCSCIDTE